MLNTPLFLAIDSALLKRADAKCELCGSDDGLAAYDIPPITIRSLDKSILLCSTCLDQVVHPEKMKPNHWRSLSETMWSQTPAIQVMSWRLLNRLKGEGWSDELLEILYMEDNVKKWAVADDTIRPVDEPTLDINGVPFATGDSAIMTKDIFITGANVTAKRGAVIKNISLTDNARQIEGNLNGTRIVLGGRYLKKG